MVRLCRLCTRIRRFSGEKGRLFSAPCCTGVSVEQPYAAKGKVVAGLRVKNPKKFICQPLRDGGGDRVRELRGTETEMLTVSVGIAVMEDRTYVAFAPVDLNLVIVLYFASYVHAIEVEVLIVDMQPLSLLEKYCMLAVYTHILRFIRGALSGISA